MRDLAPSPFSFSARIVGFASGALLLLGGCLMALDRPAPEVRSWRTTSALELVFEDDRPDIRRTERNVHFRAEPHEGGPVRYLVIETEVRTHHRWLEKGTEGRVSVRAWRLKGSAPERELAYAFESEGTAIAVGADFIGDDFIVIELDHNMAEAVSRFYYVLTGQFAFEALGRPAWMALTLNGFRKRRIAAYSPLSPRIPRPRTNDDRIVGVVAYATLERLLSEALLMADDAEYAWELSSALDERPSVTWIDVRTGEQPDPYYGDENRGIEDVALRLRFRGSGLDVFIPVTAEGIDYGRLKLPEGLALVPLERAR